MIGLKKTICIFALCASLPFSVHAAPPKGHPGEPVANAIIKNKCQVEQRKMLKVLGKIDASIGELNAMIEALAASGHLTGVGTGTWTLVNWEPC